MKANEAPDPVAGPRPWRLVVAAVLGIPVGTVGSRLHEARDRLRALLAARRGDAR